MILPALQSSVLRSWIGVVVLLCGSHASSPAAPATSVQLVRTPDDGIQPQAVVDSRGVLHLIYYKGKPGGGDVFYVRQSPGQGIFSTPLRVNQRPGDAIAAGSIRGAQVAIGRGGRVHVAWNGNASVPEAAHKGAPMWYTRLNEAGTAFEPERDLITFTGGLDGGGTVAADGEGRVYVLWHGAAPDNTRGEAGRSVFVARSTDDGKTFSAEKQARAGLQGVCGCCGMRAWVDGAGTVFALYRAAVGTVNRNEVLLASRDHGDSFEEVYSHPWNTAACPMSSAWLTAAPGGTLAAWESVGQVYFATVNPKSLSVSTPISPAGQGKRKHPVAALNARGERLFAWTEGTGWQKGGAVAWQLFDTTGQPTAEKGRAADGVPVWGLVAAVARPDGSFVIFH